MFPMTCPSIICAVLSSAVVKLYCMTLSILSWGIPPPRSEILMLKSLSLLTMVILMRGRAWPWIPSCDSTVARRAFFSSSGRM